MPRHRTGHMLPCANCSNLFYRSAADIQRSTSNVYCSVVCYAARNGRKTPSSRPGSPCRHCGEDTGATENALARGVGRFCSEPCRRAHRLTDVSVAERFWRRVNKNGPIPPHRPEIGECWIWTGSTASDGYGRAYAWGKSWPTQQLAWRLTHGVIPTGSWGLHHCDNPPCVRPTHIFLGTQTDNMRDMAAKGRASKRGRPR